jgi:hypothetical protein
MKTRPDFVSAVRSCAFHKVYRANQPRARIRLLKRNMLRVLWRKPF